MGRQAVHFAMGLSGLSSFMMLIGLCSRFHRLSFYSLGFVKAMDLEVYLLFGKVEMANSDPCSAISSVAPESVSACEDLAGGHDLLDLSHRFCSPLITNIFRQSCSGMSMAYAVGLALVVFTLVNMVLQGISTFLLYNYVYKKAQKKLREVSKLLVCIGACIVALILIVYMPAVSMQLDNISVSVPGGSMVIDVAKGTGIAKGYMLMWIAVMVQIVQIILHKYAKLSEEDRLADLKMQDQFESQLADGTGGGYPPQSGYGGGGYPPQSGGGYAPQSGAGYPPQSGGGYVPQSGGGYPPQSGAGYPPQSGGVFPGSQQQYAGNPQMPMSGQQWQQPAPQYGQQPGYGF